MGGVAFYRDASLPFFELKSCSIDALTYKKHAHDEYSLGFIEQGRTNLWYEGKQLDIEQNKFVIIPPQGLHACHPCTYDKWHYAMLYVDANWLEGLASTGVLLNGKQPIVLDPSVADKQNLARLLRIFTSTVSPLAKESAMITGLMALLSNAQMALSIEPSAHKRKLLMMQEYLKAHYLDKITLDDLEKVAGLNKFYLVRLFKKEFNISPHAYQTLLRINYAKKELRINQPLVDVAAKLGFFDQSHFTKAFKGYVGATPEGYRKSCKKSIFYNT
jgi:AraC-like DNA-binding protein